MFFDVFQFVIKDILCNLDVMSLFLFFTINFYAYMISVNSLLFMESCTAPLRPTFFVLVPVNVGLPPQYLSQLPPGNIRDRGRGKLTREYHIRRLHI